MEDLVTLKDVVFTWTVKNFDICMQSTGEYIKSPEFSSDTLNATNFCLKLYPRGVLGEDGKHISIFLGRNKDCGPEKILLQFQVCLVDANKSYIGVKRSEEQEYSKDTSWGFQKYFERELLLNSDNDILLNNDLTIECRLFPSLSRKRGVDHYEVNFSDQVSEVLSSEFAEILNSAMHSDMTIEVNGESFHVHQAVLECRCPKLMLKLKTVEVPNTFTLPDIEASELRQLLSYLYTGIISASYGGIFTASRNYDLPALCDAFPYQYIILANTDINVTRAKFKWIIKNISQRQENEELVYNPFYKERLNKRIQIVLSVKRNEIGPTEVLLNFRRECTNTNTFIRCTVLLENPGEIRRTIQVFEHIFKKDKNWMANLFSTITLSESLRSDTLNLYFQISLSQGEENSRINEVRYQTETENVGEESIKHFKLLQKDFEKLHKNSMFRDITLLVGDTELPAHKVILCARSRVFARMFENDMLEKQTGVIEIKDIDLPTVSSMLLYIYCGSVKNTAVNKCIKLYNAADKYELFALKDKCSMFLQSNLSTVNIEDILLLAYRHNDASLCRCVHEFIISNAGELMNLHTFYDRLASSNEAYEGVLRALLRHISRLNGEN